MDTPTEAMAHDDHSQLCWQHRCDWWDPKGWWCKSTSNSSWPSFVSVVVLVVKQTCMWKGTHLLERIFYLNHIKMKCNVSKCWAMQSFWKKYHIKRGIAKTKNPMPHAWDFFHPGTSWPKGFDQTWSWQKRHQRKPNNHPDQANESPLSSWVSW